MAFKEYLKEAAKPKTVAVLFGRMNPPTKGHEENVEGLKKVAKEHNADHLVIASHSHDAKKNPLSTQQKTKHLKRAFPNTNVTSSSKEKPTLFHHLSDLHKQGYTHVVLAGGSDRSGELSRLNDYNGKEGKHGFYNFKSIKTVNTGERKQGVSGTDMRTHASNNDFASFRKGLPSKLAAHEGHAKELFHDTRSGMGLHENAVSNLVYDIREQYVAGKVFKIGQRVEASDGTIGNVVFRGSNHLTVETVNGDKLKYWLNEVKEIMNTSFRNFAKQQKVPMLLMTNEQKSKMFEDNSKELNFDGIQTNHFYMCPSATIEFRKMIDTIRSGKHIGELAGHVTTKQPTTTNTDVVNKVEAGMAVKPERIRQMQFRQYMGL
jgi:nicotinamide mononucleotide adenylyltransferase